MRLCLNAFRIIAILTILGMNRSEAKTNWEPIDIYNEIGALFQSGEWKKALPLALTYAEIVRKRFGPKSTQYALACLLLHDAYRGLDELGDALKYAKLALPIWRKAVGEKNEDTRWTQIRVAKLMMDLNVEIDQAENILADSIRISKKYKIADEIYRQALQRLGSLLSSSERFRDAEPLLIEALSVGERLQSDDDPRNTTPALYELSYLYFRLGDWMNVIEYARKYSTVHENEIFGSLEIEGNNSSDSRYDKKGSPTDWLVLAAWQQSKQTPQFSDRLGADAFMAAQWYSLTRTGIGVAWAAKRNEFEDEELARLVRDRQDNSTQFYRARRRFQRNLKASGIEDPSLKQEMNNLLENLKAHNEVITKNFPEASIVPIFKPVKIEDIQKKLGNDEAITFFHLVGEEIFVWVVVKEEFAWTRLEIPTRELVNQIQALRCGLDIEEWNTIGRESRCRELLDVDEPADDVPEPFDLYKAYNLYRALFEWTKGLTAGKRLFIAASGPITALPFQVLVTRAPAEALPKTYEGYTGVSWLGAQQDLSVIPSVSSFKAFEERPAKELSFAAWGAPDLKGDQNCPPRLDAAEVAICVEGLRSGHNGHISAKRGRRRVRGPNPQDFSVQGMTSGQLISLVRQQCPLPETASEIRCISESLKTGDNHRRLRLGKEMTEQDIKTLSRHRDLAKFDVLHFATHGFASAKDRLLGKIGGESEPALVMTPPEHPSNEDDDGLLETSEISMLHLDANWVILSACNTAAGDQLDGEALSGFARSFLYAGARSVLVSHWPVESDAAVEIVTRMFKLLKDGVYVDRAEALRASAFDLMHRTDVTNGGRWENAHPAVWAPFTIVQASSR